MSRIKLVKFSSYCKLTAHQQGRETGRVYSCHQKNGKKKKRNKISSVGQVSLGTSDHAVWEIRFSGYLGPLHFPPLPRVSRTITIRIGLLPCIIRYSPVNKHQENSPGNKHYFGGKTRDRRKLERRRNTYLTELNVEKSFYRIST